MQSLLLLVLIQVQAFDMSSLSDRRKDYEELMAGFANTQVLPHFQSQPVSPTPPTTEIIYPAALDALLQVESVIFKTSGLVNFRISTDTTKGAQYDVATHTITMHPELRQQLQTFSSDDQAEILSYIFAHEISHMMLDNHCLQSESKLTIIGKRCSISFVDASQNIPPSENFEYLQTYGEEHLEIDYMAYLILEKLGHSKKAVAKFLELSPKPWGESKRITTVLQEERMNRIALAKSHNH
jgi:hypothetical protein